MAPTVSVDELLAHIGRLYVENAALRKRIAELESEGPKP